MSLVRWKPFSDLVTLQDQLNRLFEDSGRRGVAERSLDAAWTPAVDVLETPEAYVIKAELPEIKSKDVSIHLENNVLTLSGERKLEQEDNKDNYHTIERFHGRFSRSFSLPGSVDQDKVVAEAKDGVLRINLPKKPESKPKAVEIKVK